MQQKTISCILYINICDILEYIKLLFYSINAPLTATIVSIRGRGSFPNLVRTSLYVRLAALYLTPSSVTFLDLEFTQGLVLAIA